MGTFTQLQRKSGISSTAAASSTSFLRSSRPFAPLPTAASQPVPPVAQEQLERAARYGHSFEHISILPPEKKNTTGLHDTLKASVEQLSGLSMDDVQVHYHSSKPAQVQALAYTQGTEIHVGPGQEKHLPHEAWHVVQQMQGRVKPTIWPRGQAINDDQGLEQEAESMGKKAASAANMTRVSHVKEAQDVTGQAKRMLVPKTIQRVKGVDMKRSDKEVIRVYIELLMAKEFAKMHKLVTTHDDLILVDSSATQNVAYDPIIHAIKVPMKTPEGAPRPRSDIMAEILWEMHNALNRGAHRRTEAKFSMPALDPNPTTPEEKQQAAYKKAAQALSREWDEWTRTVEYHFRTGTINQQLGRDPVARPFEKFFAHPEKGWYEFKIYLQLQIDSGHTISYDADAQKADWKGKRIFRAVQERNSKSLIITDKQVRDWQKGSKIHVKESATNPFKTLSIIEDILGQDIRYTYWQSTLADAYSCSVNLT